MKNVTKYFFKCEKLKKTWIRPKFMLTIEKHVLFLNEAKTNFTNCFSYIVVKCAITAALSYADYM